MTFSKSLWFLGKALWPMANAMQQTVFVRRESFAELAQCVGETSFVMHGAKLKGQLSCPALCTDVSCLCMHLYRCAFCGRG